MRVARIIMTGKFIGELVVSWKRETLSAKVSQLDNLEYSRYSVFFNQEIEDIGPSHMLISKRLVNKDYKWVCEDKSTLQDEELAGAVGLKIDELFGNAGQDLILYIK